MVRQNPGRSRLWKTLQIIGMAAGELTQRIRVSGGNGNQVIRVLAFFRRKDGGPGRFADNDVGIGAAETERTDAADSTAV